MESLILMKILMKKRLRKKIKNNKDIFSRGFKLKEITIDESFPSYILKNKFLLKDWII